VQPNQAHGSDKAKDWRTCNTANNQPAALIVPLMPPGSVSPVTFATMPASAAPNAVANNCTVVINADARACSPAGLQSMINGRA
jgi:hypothetical protein